MSAVVPGGEIESIVGVARHPTVHYGRAVSLLGTVYILHSQECRNALADLRECRFSLALDRGIEAPLPWSIWKGVQDRPTMLGISHGYLVPDFADYAEPADR